MLSLPPKENSVDHAFIQQHALIYRYPEYEIVHLNPQNNTLIARRETAPYAVSLSGGLGSAFAGERAIQRYGRDKILLWFADVLAEDPDLYRFLSILMKRWGGRLYYYTDGRRPVDVWTQHKIIPCNLIAPCSMDLKVAPFRAFIRAMPHLPRVFIGFKPKEKIRQAKTLASYKKAIPDAEIEYPLLWDPPETRDLVDACWTDWHIAPPLLYWLGFDYNNCGGDCCRAGIQARVREAVCFPTRFAQSESWEQWARSHGGARAHRSFCARQHNGVKQSLTLTQIREEYLPYAETLLDKKRATLPSREQHADCVPEEDASSDGKGKKGEDGAPL